MNKNFKKFKFKKSNAVACNLNWIQISFILFLSIYISEELCVRIFKKIVLHYTRLLPESYARKFN
jgi:hypothetical protein